MSTQENNPENINILATYFPKRNEPTYALGNAISMFRSMPNLRGFWPFSAVSATGAVADISGSAMNLTNTAVDIGLDLVISYALFDGATANLSRADHAALDITGTEAYIVTAQRGLSMGGYVRVDALGSQEAFISKWTTGQEAYRIFKLATNVVRAEIHSGLGATNVDSTATISATTWTYFAMQFDPSTELTVWVNDTKATLGAAIPASIAATTAIFDLGRTDGGSLLTGRMALPFLYGSFLPDYMIRQFYWQTKGLFGL